MTVKQRALLNREYVDYKVQFPINIVQFGTGVLLRGLVDYIFQLANNNGAENAVAMVKSTSAETQSFKAQDGLYTIVSSGLNADLNQSTDSTLIRCIQDILSAENEWAKLEAVFTSDSLSLVVSNVTEAGLIYDPKIKNSVPVGYPAKLTHLLYKRYLAFGGDPAKGLIIIPTELLVDNGKILYQFVQQHSYEMGYADDFRSWLENSCFFCDSLVDRIVPGKWTDNPNFTLPYIDNLAVATEPYYLWAVKGNHFVNEYFNKYKGIKGFVVTEDLTPYREQKLRLLNGCHTLLTPIAYALGCKTVEEMINSPILYSFFIQVVETEILPTLKNISPTAAEFYKHMTSRWKNPSIKHELKSILAQSVTKMQIRNGDTFIRFYEEFEYLPPFLTFGFAIFLRVYQPKVIDKNTYLSEGNPFPLIEFNDQKAEALYSYWHKMTHADQNAIKACIADLLSDKTIFDHKFVSLPGFTDKIISHYLDIEKNGLESCILHQLNLKARNDQ